MLPEILSSLADAALADGMDADVATITFVFGADRGVKLSATSGAGVEYTSDVTAEELMVALDLEGPEAADAEVPA